MTAGGGSRRIAEDAGIRADLDSPYRSGGGLGGAERVDDDREVGAGPGLDNTRRFTVELEQARACSRRAAGQSVEHGRSRAVVAPVPVADPDDDRPVHVRSTRMSRKCVAHEMHGS